MSETPTIQKLLDLAKAEENPKDFLLHKVAQASSDLTLARHLPRFREAAGGMAQLEAEHTAATRAWEKWRMGLDDE